MIQGFLSFRNEAIHELFGATLSKKICTIGKFVLCVIMYFSHEVALEVDIQCKGGTKEGPLFVWFSKFILLTVNIKIRYT